jgi:hypothetical protein
MKPFPFPSPSCLAQVVVLSSVLACDATLGYESTLGIKDSAVREFNGHPVNNLAQVGGCIERACLHLLHGWRQAPGGLRIWLAPKLFIACAA